MTVASFFIHTKDAEKRIEHLFVTKCFTKSISKLTPGKVYSLPHNVLCSSVGCGDAWRQSGQRPPRSRKTLSLRPRHPGPILF